MDLGLYVTARIHSTWALLESFYVIPVLWAYFDCSFCNLCPAGRVPVHPDRPEFQEPWFVGPSFMRSSGPLAQRVHVPFLKALQWNPESWTMTVLQPQSLDKNENQPTSSQINIPTILLSLLQSLKTISLIAFGTNTLMVSMYLDPLGSVGCAPGSAAADAQKMASNLQQLLSGSKSM